jgi:DNA-binding CsgD family transcriptional regulator
MAALRRAQLSGDAALYDYADAQTRHLSPHSWIRRAIAKAHERPVHLTKTQEEIVALICQGKSNPEIARLRGRSENTVRNHITKIFERLGVNSREEVAVEAVVRGFW